VGPTSIARPQATSQSAEGSQTWSAPASTALWISSSQSLARGVQSNALKARENVAQGGALGNELDLFGRATSMVRESRALSAPNNQPKGQLSSPFELSSCS